MKTKYKNFAEVLEEGALEQFKSAMELDCVIQGALMPDAHQGYTFPIGSVIKTKDEVFPSGVGYDIGCGCSALELGVNYKEVDLEKLKEHILDTIPIGFNTHSEPQDTSSLNFTGTSDSLKDVFSKKGKKSIGTLGGGNHFIEIGYSEKNENIIIVIHSGSRGFGHGVASFYMNEAMSLSSESDWEEKKSELEIDFELRNSLFKEKNEDGFLKAKEKFIKKNKEQYFKKQNVEGLYSLNINSEIGNQYLVDLDFCLDYALLNRKIMTHRIAEGIQFQFNDTIQDIQFINRNHNHAELKDGFIIHRKGATHAEQGMFGVIPGNMRDGSFIVQGKGNEESMCSSSHGAGRVLSRKKAKETLSLDEFHKDMKGMVTNHSNDTLDEAPGAYKNIFEVMELQKDLVQVVDRVIPILNIKG